MPLFIWTEKEGRPTLERGASTLITIPELPTLPFHLDLPICIGGTEYKKMSIKYYSSFAVIHVQIRHNVVISTYRN